MLERGQIKGINSIPTVYAQQIGVRLHFEHIAIKQNLMHDIRLHVQWEFQHIKVSKVKWNETKQTDFLLKIGDLSYITRFTEKNMIIAIEMTLLNSARVQISFPLSCRPDVICRFKYEKSWNQEITNVRRHIYRQICDFPDYISIYHFLLNSW